MTNERPRVVDGLDVNEVDDGLVVFEPSRDLVHYLNATAAVVFTLCDGTRDLDELVAVVAKVFELGESPQREVEECLTQLRNQQLLR